MLLVTNVKSLSQIFTLNMSVYARVRKRTYPRSVTRFNERLIVSLSSNPNCIIVDDKLNLVTTSESTKNLEILPCDYQVASCSSATELKDLCTSLTKTLPTGPLISKCKTLDQARALLRLLDALMESSVNSTFILTAPRGRGKSATLGLAVAGAVALGFTNIIASAASLENLRSFFNFVIEGLNALGYVEHLEYEVVEATSPSWGSSCPFKVSLHSSHRQTIQFVEPKHYFKSSQAELLIVDEAAAIPIPILRRMLGPVLVFMSSTTEDFQDRIKQIQTQDRYVNVINYELKLFEPTRYSIGDKIELWLNDLLCLNLNKNEYPRPHFLPYPKDCSLYYVNRDTLFSFHKTAEKFLKYILFLFAYSNLKNAPNDLLLISDCDNHHIFVLLGCINKSMVNITPEILCAMQ